MFASNLILVYVSFCFITGVFGAPTPPYFKCAMWTGSCPPGLQCYEGTGTCVLTTEGKPANGPDGKPLDLSCTEGSQCVYGYACDPTTLICHPE